MDPIGVLKRTSSLGGGQPQPPRPRRGRFHHGGAGGGAGGVALLARCAAGTAPGAAEGRAALARAAALAALAALAICGPSFPVSLSRSLSIDESSPAAASAAAAAARTLVIVGSASPSSPDPNAGYWDDEAVLKQRLALEHEGTPSSPTRSTAYPYRNVRTVLLDPREQRDYVAGRKAVCGIRRYDELLEMGQRQLAAELFKYCALLSAAPSSSSRAPKTDEQGEDALLVDLESPLLLRVVDLLRLVPAEHSLAVLGDPARLPGTAQSGPVLLLRRRHVAPVAGQMLRLLVETPLETLALEPLLVQRYLYQLLEALAATNQARQDPAQPPTPGLRPGSNGGEVYVMEMACRMNPLRRIATAATDAGDQSRRASVARLEADNRDDDDEVGLFACPRRHEYCCSVIDRPAKQIVAVSRQPAIPNFYVPKAAGSERCPYDASGGAFEEDELPFVSTIRDAALARPPDRPKDTPNLYEILYSAGKLPGTKCTRCLHLRKCERYEHYCERYVREVCQTPYPPKFVSKRVAVTPPLYRRDPTRLVPRIVHQTWYEDLDPRRYPNMSRLVESWKLSGWEYKFYSDADAAAFLRTHFPPEVLQAYLSLVPGAFKADLFRYCALLVHGGVYADVDILLESSLDAVVEPDVGFMVPVDEPEGCVWQGLIAASPGHPFLAHAIETVVNQVRNRFTSVDIDATFCPKPRFKVLHSFDVLFTAGPCLLGSSMNRVLGRHGQELFEPGDLLPRWEEAPEEEGGGSGANATPSAFDGGGARGRPRVPGRTVLLKQNKGDMGAHRFTYAARNLVVAATDLENSDDRKNWPKKEDEEEEDKEPRSSDKTTRSDEDKDGSAQNKAAGGAGGEHYSKAHARTGIYGIEGLYVDHELVDEDIRIVVVDPRQSPHLDLDPAPPLAVSVTGSQATVGADAQLRVS